MRADPVAIHMQQQARKPEPPLQALHAQGLDAKLNAKTTFLKELGDKGSSAYINYVMTMAEAKKQSAGQFSATGETYYPWLKSSLAELGTALIGNIVDRYG